MTDLTALIAALPKAELHLHLEGSLEPEMMFALAKRNGVKLKYGSVEEIRAAYDFSNLQDFLDLYYQGMGVLLTEADFYDLTFAYLKRVHADNVKHVEVFFDPQAHMERGVSFETVLNGVTSALKDGEGEFGVTYKLIMCFLRHLSEEEAFELLSIAEPHLSQIYGVGLDSSELGHPPSKFQRVFAKARELGLKLVAHAGEEGPPEYVWEALNLLNIDRIDHGNASALDDTLLAEIKSRELTLTMCPLSNQRLCVTEDLTENPLARLLRAGVRVTVNSDDPSYFGGYINDNYLAITKALNLSADEIVELARNSFKGAFLPEAEKNAYLAEIDRISV
ncbi:adenosine deaminase [Ponticaulis sp.]|uniref:adenosine deaminase n=1 Tax=Ponticaulis sp. TaxID=2020902 RepID=UPI000B6CDFD0|nr:adenosine deaminase [Ponticaulis sp.]MAI88928.1 adenosine deaminase [Ponticaulis sp.]OUY01615.1 MAG: adenosine deaminase [Hyphomonadaceae bacterium TMED5]|tara:strand:+ start:48688 stop:49695 length:1008 start_codon:yes stop_codon:yes gene_type:complete